MSNTKKGSKGPGYEYWGKRPTKAGAYASPSKENKTKTHRLERHKAARAVRQDMDL